MSDLCRLGMMMAMLLAPALTGCASCGLETSTIKDRIPPRPTELDRLNMLAGQWRTSGEVRMLGIAAPIHTIGKSEATWECDRRLLVERSSFDMGELGPMSGMSVWSYDAGRRRFEMHWFDSFGESAAGTARFDEKRGLWRMRVRGRNAVSSITALGTIRRIDENTLEWTWKQYDALGLIKFADMRGTSNRQ